MRNPACFVISLNHDALGHESHRHLLVMVKLFNMLYRAKFVQKPYVNHACIEQCIDDLLGTYPGAICDSTHYLLQGGLTETTEAVEEIIKTRTQFDLSARLYTLTVIGSTLKIVTKE